MPFDYNCWGILMGLRNLQTQELRNQNYQLWTRKLRCRLFRPVFTAAKSDSKNAKLWVLSVNLWLARSKWRLLFASLTSFSIKRLSRNKSRNCRHFVQYVQLSISLDKILKKEKKVQKIFSFYFKISLFICVCLPSLS